MNNVLPRLYIGSHRDLADPEMLKRVGIKVILKLFEDRDDLNRLPEGFIAYDRPCNDGPGWGSEEFIAFNEIIVDHLLKDEAVLVVCAAGKSRSATVILNYLLCVGFEFDKALVHLKRCRPEIDPSIHLLGALIDHHHLHPYLGTVDPKWL